ncbi:MAG TPA: hypothetical protein VGV40_05590, partial [Solirubrobacteraceae bacterium]|nr:hypothetical protein [Solirubrobacteraceae bacterium]
LARRAERGWAVALRDGPVVHLGSAENLAAKWVSAAAVLGDPSSRGAAYVDVRMPERPVAGGLALLPGEEPAPLGAPGAPAASGAPAEPSAPAPAPGPGSEGVSGEAVPPGAISPDGPAVPEAP